MTCSRKEELCKHCQNLYQEYKFFDGKVIQLTVDRCRMGHNLHSPELECDDFEGKLGYKIKSIFKKRGD